jgi:hypothetical protein
VLEALFIAGLAVAAGVLLWLGSRSPALAETITNATITSNAFHDSGSAGNDT